MKNMTTNSWFSDETIFSEEKLNEEKIIRLSDLWKEYNLTKESLQYTMEYMDDAREYMEQADSFFSVINERFQTLDQIKDYYMLSGEADKETSDKLTKSYSSEIVNKIQQVVQRVILAIQNIIKTLITYVRGSMAQSQSKFYNKNKHKIPRALSKNGNSKKFKGVLMKGGRKNIAKNIINLMIRLNNMYTDPYLRLTNTISSFLKKKEKNRESGVFIKQYNKLLSVLGRIISVKDLNSQSEGQLTVFDLKVVKRGIARTIYRDSEGPTTGESTVIEQFPNAAAFEILDQKYTKQILVNVGTAKKISKDIKNIGKTVFGKDYDKAKVGRLNSFLKLTNSIVVNIILNIANIFFRERSYATSALKKILNVAEENKGEQ